MHTVAFICTANVCRSSMAHAILAAEVARRNLPMRVYSAGIMDFRAAPPADNAWITCLQHKTPLQKMESTYVGQLDLAGIHHFLVMERRHAEVLIRAHKIAPERIAMLSSYDPLKGTIEIADPTNGGIVAFEECYQMLQSCIKTYLASLSLPPSEGPARHDG